MTDAFVTVDGHPVEKLHVHVPNVGPWWCDCDLIDEGPTSGRVIVGIGDSELSGTIDVQSGNFGDRSQLRIVAGANGWRSQVPAQAYHNDAGVSRRLVADDAAIAIGEELGIFAPAELLRADYVRPSGTAATVIESVAGGQPWWVDYDGVTHVAERATISASNYELLTYNPRLQCATLAIDELSDVSVGSVIADRLDPPITVRELEIKITPDSMLATVWHMESATARSPLAQTIESIVRRSANDDRLYGCYRYRVVGMVGDRVSVRAANPIEGMPDMALVDIWPGLAGAAMTLIPGADVLVSFIDGVRTSPIITHFTNKSGTGFVPASVDLLGNGNGLNAGRQGDLVRSGGIGTIASFGLIPPDVVPAMSVGKPYLISFGPVAPTPVLAAPLYGALATGSNVVRIG